MLTCSIETIPLLIGMRSEFTSDDASNSAFAKCRVLSLLLAAALLMPILASVVLMTNARIYRAAKAVFLSLGKTIIYS
ncbi:hypothetical protein [Psychrobacter sp. KH172YL61]|uniref:hypothetical protein n=1 Tax=Psychrobacter sp. KH172YL61 TaxID=2517899 RepID=UPI001F08438F|nr:hypothetical protein [Psychrobacter sp. KH172YL61]